MTLNTFFLSLTMLLGAIHVDAQYLDDAEKKRILENREFFLSHNILLGDYSYDNPELNTALHAALNNRNKQHKNSTAGSFLLGSGAAGVILGLLFTSTGKRNSNDIRGTAERGLGNVMITAGAIMASCSVPFFVASGNRRRDMERSLNLARDLRKQ